MVATGSTFNERILVTEKKEFLLSLQTRQKWTRPRKNLQVNDIVIVNDDDIPRNQWRMGRVIEAEPDQDGFGKMILDVGSPSLTLEGKINQPLSTWKGHSTS